MDRKMAQGIAIHTLRRIGLGISIKRFSKLTGISSSRISKIELGNIEMTPQETSLLTKLVRIRKMIFEFFVDYFMKIDAQTSSEIDTLRNQITKLPFLDHEGLKKILLKYETDDFSDTEIQSISARIACFTLFALATGIQKCE